MKKIFKCPHCGASNKETSFTVVSAYICEVEFDDNDWYSGDIQDAYDTGVDNQFYCENCGNDFDDFDEEELVASFE